MSASSRFSACIRASWRGRIGLQRGQGAQGAHRPAAAHARQQARRDPGNSGGRYLRGGGLEDGFTGDTICDADHPIVLESIDIPDAGDSVGGRAARPRRTRKSWAWRSQKLAQEDPTFRVNTDPETGQTILSGMGELHLEIIVDRMMREFGVAANVGKPQVAYRETIRQDRRKPRTRTRSRPAAAASMRAPNCGWSPARGRATSSKTISKAATSPRNSSPAVGKGIVEALEGGILAGFPMVGHQSLAVRRQTITK